MKHYGSLAAMQAEAEEVGCRRREGPPTTPLPASALACCSGSAHAATHPTLQTWRRPLFHSRATQGTWRTSACLHSERVPCRQRTSRESVRWPQQQQQQQQAAAALDGREGSCGPRKRAGCRAAARRTPAPPQVPHCGQAAASQPGVNGQAAGASRAGAPTRVAVDAVLQPLAADVVAHGLRGQREREREREDGRRGEQQGGERAQAGDRRGSLRAAAAAARTRSAHAGSSGLASGPCRTSPSLGSICDLHATGQHSSPNSPTFMPEGNRSGSPRRRPSAGRGRWLQQSSSTRYS